MPYNTSYQPPSYQRFYWPFVSFVVSLSFPREEEWNHKGHNGHKERKRSGSRWTRGEHVNGTGTKQRGQAHIMGVCCATAAQDGTQNIGSANTMPIYAPVPFPLPLSFATLLRLVPAHPVPFNSAPITSLLRRHSPPAHERRRVPCPRLCVGMRIQLACRGMPTQSRGHGTQPVTITASMIHTSIWATWISAAHLGIGRSAPAW